MIARWPRGLIWHAFTGANLRAFLTLLGGLCLVPFCLIVAGTVIA